MITVHHLADSRSQRILWLCEELGLDYQVRRYERDPDTMLAPAALKEIHPLGKAPVIERDGIVLAESGAIVQHLIGLGGPMTPGTTEGIAADLEWLHAAEGSLQPLLLMALLFRLMPERAPALTRPLVRKVADTAMSGFVTPRLHEQFGHLNERLRTHDWLAGGDGPTGADVMMIFPLEAALARADGMDRYAAIRAYVDRVWARDAYERALQKGGAYAYGPPGHRPGG